MKQPPNPRILLFALLIALMSGLACQSQSEPPVRVTRYLDSLGEDGGLQLVRQLAFVRPEDSSTVTAIRGRIAKVAIEQEIDGVSHDSEGYRLYPEEGELTLLINATNGQGVDVVHLDVLAQAHEGIRGAAGWDGSDIRMPFGAARIGIEQTAWTTLEFSVPRMADGASGVLRLDFSEMPSPVVISRLWLYREPASGATRKQLDGLTLDARRVTARDAFEWNVRVPEGPTLLQYAMAVAPSPGPTPGAVTFRTVAVDGSQRTELVSHTLDTNAKRPQWTHAQFDLSAYGGRSITLRFETVDKQPIPSGNDHRILWGDPRIFLQPKRDEFNVIVLAIDTLRADHLSSYGNDIALTPAIDALGQQGARFSQCVANSPWTLPSFASLLTGQYPSTHGGGTMMAEIDSTSGVRGSLPLPDDARTLPEILSENGFRTALHFNNIYLGADFGIHQGWDEARDFRTNGFETVHRSLEWLRDGQGERNFLFLHLMEPHRPYDPPEPFQSIVRRMYEQRRSAGDGPFSQLSADRWRSAVRYGGEVAYTDYLIGRFLRGLRNLGLENHTLVILTSDHGEEFWEHEAIQESRYDDGERGFSGVGHGHTQYREVLDVPLVVRFPGRVTPGTNVDALVQLHDIAPSILSWVGLDPSPNMEGQSLLDLINGQPGRAFAFSEFTRYGPERTAFTEPQFKRIESPKFVELYDRLGDPDEQDDLAATQPDRLESVSLRAQAALQARQEFQLRFRESGYARDTVEPDLSPEQVERLRSLGYID